MGFCLPTKSAHGYAGFQKTGTENDPPGLPVGISQTQVKPSTNRKLGLTYEEKMKGAVDSFPGGIAEAAKHAAEHSRLGALLRWLAETFLIDAAAGV